MWDRVLVAMDEFEAGQAALALGAGLARSTGASVVVLHVREVTPLRRGAQLLTSGEAGRLVEEAVTSLRSTGIDATGVLSKVRQNRTARAIVAEAESWGCDAIVLGSARRRGPSRLVGGGIHGARAAPVAGHRSYGAVPAAGRRPRPGPPARGGPGTPALTRAGAPERLPAAVLRFRHRVGAPLGRTAARATRRGGSSDDQ